MKAARSNIKNRHRKLQYRVTWGHLLYGQKLVPSGSYGHQETKTDDEILTCIHRKSIVCLCTKQSHSGKDAATPLLIYVFFFFYLPLLGCTPVVNLTELPWSIANGIPL